MSFDFNKIDTAHNNTDVIIDKCIKSIRLCLHDTENVINVAIKMIKSKNSNSSDIAYLENDYLSQVTNLKSYFASVTHEAFANDIKNKVKELTELYKLIGTKVTPIINKNNVQEVAKIMSNMPVLVTDMFSSIKDYAIAIMQEVNVGKSEMVKSDKLSFLNNTSNTNNTIKPLPIATNPIFGQQLNEDQQGILASMSGSIGTVLGNLWNIITFKSTNGVNPISTSIKDATDNINSLNAQINKTITKNATMADIGSFFTSDAFVRTATGLLVMAGLVIVIRKAYKRIAQYLGKTWKKNWY